MKMTSRPGHPHSNLTVHVPACSGRCTDVRMSGKDEKRTSVRKKKKKRRSMKQKRVQENTKSRDLKDFVLKGRIIGRKEDERDKKQLRALSEK